MSLYNNYMPSNSLLVRLTPQSMILSMMKMTLKIPLFWHSSSLIHSSMSLSPLIRIRWWSELRILAIDSTLVPLEILWQSTWQTSFTRCLWLQTHQVTDSTKWISQRWLLQAISSTLLQPPLRQTGNSIWLRLKSNISIAKDSQKMSTVWIWHNSTFAHSMFQLVLLRSHNHLPRSPLKRRDFQLGRLL